MITESKQQLLNKIIEDRFYAGAVYDYENLAKFLSHPNFPNREKEFKKELSDAIQNSKVSINEFEKLTGIDYESQKEVNEFLKTEVWQPLYGEESIKV